MTCATRLGSILLLSLVLVSPASILAQTKDDTIVYGLQSDVQNWDPPNSVLRESIILGYNVFDHLAARDLKTGQGRPEPRAVVEERRRHHLGGQAAQRREIPRRHAVLRQGRQGHVRPRAESREQAHRARQPRQDQERRGRRRPHRPLQDRRPLPAVRRAPHRPGDAVREGHPREGPRVDAGEPRRYRPVQAREVEQEARAPPAAQRRLLGAQAGLQVRPHPDHPGAGHPDCRVDLRAASTSSRPCRPTRWT